MRPEYDFSNAVRGKYHHSGPWLVAAAVLVAFYVHSKPWEVWIFGGALVGLLVYLFSVQSLPRKVRRKKRENAA